MNHVRTIYPTCCHFIKTAPPLPLDQQLKMDIFLADHPEFLRDHPYLIDLARIEATRYTTAENLSPVPNHLNSRQINPNLTLIEVEWQNLPQLLLDHTVVPHPAKGFVLIWIPQGENKVQCADASSHDLIALKMVTEQIDSRTAALEGNVSIGAIENLLYKAEHKGLLIAPASRIVRPPEFHQGEVTDPGFFTTPTFTLQWHITQTCDLHCRHCYDRSAIADPDLKQCIRVLDELYDFCNEHHVHTQVTFTGGNPLLYTHFNQLYQEAADRGFMTAILGNPMPRDRIEEILAIRKPEFYQVSLEGLCDHNDYIRGRGHFDRVFTFLDLLQELDIYSMVMLTLTRANMDQVLDLAELLRGRVDLFTFNRLAMVGEGAELTSVPPAEYQNFLKAYLTATEENPCMGLKDNLINIQLHESGKELFGGCAGKGCGAAFNFVALLPNGEVHACRKFPSPIGNLNTQSLTDIYHGVLAKKYRKGPAACAECSIRPVCGGCLAVAYGFGLDIFSDRDPYCCIDSLQTADG